MGPTQGYSLPVCQVEEKEPEKKDIEGTAEAPKGREKG